MGCPDPKRSNVALQVMRVVSGCDPCRGSGRALGGMLGRALGGGQEKGRVLRGLFICFIYMVSGLRRSGAHDLADVIEEAVDTLAQADRFVGQIVGRLADVSGCLAGLAGRV